MKKRTTFSSVLLELILAILFFALSTSVVIRLIAAASSISRESELESRALIAMESVAETVKADPAHCGAFDETGLCRYQTPSGDDLLIDVSVQRAPTAAGMLYTIELSAVSGETPLGTLSAARYVAGEVQP